MTPAELQHAGVRALLEHLGPADTLRFLRQYDPGHGDYTRDRHQWLDSLEDEDIIAAVQKRQSPP